MQFDNSLSFAQEMDARDTLAPFRDKFYIPVMQGKPAIYFTGNSLGLQPKTASAAIEQELEDWKNLGVEGHFHGKNPWFHYHKFLTEKAARLVGAKPIEVVIMNNLTVNLHLMMVSFYRPEGNRYKILMEGGAFPSDQYAMESQVRFHGYDYTDAVVELYPREGEHSLRDEDILAKIAELGDSLALVMFSGVQYYTGQYFDIPAITSAAHKVGATAGFDLAHAAGNVLLKLHNWDVDFAVWCSYKYLNSGPGSVSGVFVNERFANSPDLPRFAGWWGHKEDVRFQMKKGYIPEPGAAGWQLSNAPVFTMAVHNASLEIFDAAGMEALTAKSKLLTAYLQFVIEKALEQNSAISLQIITPASRGCQISMLTGTNGKAVFEYLTGTGIIADWREPNVIRIAPVPLYNTFEDVYRFGQALAKFGKQNAA